MNAMKGLTCRRDAAPLALRQRVHGQVALRRETEALQCAVDACRAVVALDAAALGGRQPRGQPQQAGLAAAIAPAHPRALPRREVELQMHEQQPRPAAAREIDHAQTRRDGSRGRGGRKHARGSASLGPQQPRFAATMRFTVEGGYISIPACDLSKLLLRTFEASPRNPAKNGRCSFDPATCRNRATAKLWRFIDALPRSRLGHVICACAASVAELVSNKSGVPCRMPCRGPRGAAPGQWLARDEAIMGTAVRVELRSDELADGEAAIDAVMAEMHRIHRAMSPFKAAHCTARRACRARIDRRQPPGDPRAENQAQAKAVTIMGDKDISYSLLRKAMVTSARADFHDVAFAVRRKEGT